MGNALWIKGLLRGRDWRSLHFMRILAANAGMQGGTEPNVNALMNSTSGSGNQSSAWRMTLAEGVAAAGGLLDVQADPGSVFLYRREPRELAELLGVDCSKMDGPTVPIVYSASFSDPAGYFLATRVQMHNKDVIFAANAQAVEITKFAAFFNTLMSIPLTAGNVAITAGTVGTTWQSLRILSKTGPSSSTTVSSTTVVSPPVVVSPPSH
jgi:hypothetical protein